MGQFLCLLAAVATTSTATSVDSIPEKPSLLEEEISHVDAVIKVQLFALGKGTRAQGGDWDNQVKLNRARISFGLYYRDLVKVVIRPDFAGLVNYEDVPVIDTSQDDDLPDLYAQFSPLPWFDLRIGQSKIPFGLLEVIGRWDIPSQRRGLVSETVADLHGFGRPRRLNIRARFRLKELSLRPKLELALVGGRFDERPDLVGRFSLRPGFKGGEVALAGYAKADAQWDGNDTQYGYAGSLSFLFQRKWAFAMIEAFTGRAKLRFFQPTQDRVNATFLVARSLLSYRFKLSDSWRIGPFIGLEALDPNLKTRDDMGGAIRFGVTARYLDMFRLSAEFDRQAGQLGFIAPAQNRLILFFGTTVETRLRGS